MPSPYNKSLVAASFLCISAAVAHLGCIVFGPSWYRFFGAGEHMAVMAQRGDLYPSVVTMVISFILFTWAAYGLAGAGVIKRLPLTKAALVIISFVFIVRGVSFPLLMPVFPDNSLTFWFISSGICLLIGGLFAIGTRQRWSMM